MICIIAATGRPRRPYRVLSVTTNPRIQGLSTTRLIAMGLASIGAIALTWFTWSIHGGDDTIPTLVQVLGFLCYAACAVALHPRLGRRRWRYIALVGAFASVLLIGPSISAINWCLSQLHNAGVLTPRALTFGIIYSGVAGVIIATSFSAIVLYIVTRSRLVAASVLVATLMLALLIRDTSDMAVAVLGSLWHAIVGGALLWWGWRASSRFGPGRCTHCGYDIRGLAPGAALCPECGQSITSPNAGPPPAPASSPAAPGSAPP